MLVAHITPWRVQCGVAKHLSYWLGVSDPQQHMILRERPPLWLPESNHFPALQEETMAWERGERSPLRKLLFCLPEGVDIVHVQFDPTFFRSDDLREFFSGLGKRGLPSVFTFHSLTGLQVYRKQERIVFQSADRLVVGTTGMYGELEKASVPNFKERVFLIPLAAPKEAYEAPPHYKGPGKPEVLLWGFPSAHKQQLESLQELERLRDIKSKLQCKVIGNPITSEQKNTMDEIWEYAQGRPWVTVEREFLEDDRLIRMCKRAHVIILNHNVQWSGSSGTVAVSVASGTPVLINNSKMFSDYEDCTEKMLPTFKEGFLRALHMGEARNRAVGRKMLEISPYTVATYHKNLYEGVRG